MKLHTNTLSKTDVFRALDAARKAGLVHPLVVFDKLAEKGSRSRTHAFEIHLEWVGDKVKGDGRRFANTGKYGADGSYAATYNEWGYFLANIFELDPNAKTDYYADGYDFHLKTRDKYDVSVEVAR